MKEIYQERLAPGDHWRSSGSSPGHNPWELGMRQAIYAQVLVGPTKSFHCWHKINYYTVRQENSMSLCCLCWVLWWDKIYMMWEKALQIWKKLRNQGEGIFDNPIRTNKREQESSAKSRVKWQKETRITYKQMWHDLLGAETSLEKSKQAT